jgi:NAD(P)-dependent dehydrogenase (short-subunit alcohol dehydrogenase family)
MTDKLAGKVSLVTGGSAGIGLGHCQRVRQRRRAGVYYRPPPVPTGWGSRFDRRQCGSDPGRRLQPRRSRPHLRNHKAQAGHIDVLAVNAGIYEFGTFGEITEEYFDKTFNTNVRGLLFTGAEGVAAAD